MHEPAQEPDVEFSDGTRARFDLVVGADGIHSAVRKVIYPHAEPEYRSFCAWRTVMECPDYDPVFRLSTTTGCFLGSFPVGAGLVYAFLLANCAEAPALSRDERLARLKELAAQFHGNVSPLIQQQQDAAGVVFVPVQEVQTPSYYQGRMLLIGDAAHAFSPLLAQGAAMAIEDAVALAELLSGSGDIDQALRSYESRRRPRVETIRAAVRRRTIARGMEGPATPELLKRHPPVFSASLKVFDELIEDPFARAQAAPDPSQRRRGPGKRQPSGASAAEAPAAHAQNDLIYTASASSTELLIPPRSNPLCFVRCQVALWACCADARAAAWPAWLLPARRLVLGPGVACPKCRCSGCQPAALETE